MDQTANIGEGSVSWIRARPGNPRIGLLGVPPGWILDATGFGLFALVSGYTLSVVL